MIITSPRLYIRPLVINDAERLFHYRKDAKVNQFQGWIPKTLKDTRNFIDNTAKKPNLPNTWFQLAVTGKDTNEFIGDIGIHFKEETEQVGLGYTIAKQQQMKGYATEALQAIISLLFSQMGKHRVTASVDPRNLPSIRVLEKLHFRKEAHFIESYRMNNEWVDDAVYAILAKEWKLK